MSKFRRQVLMPAARRAVSAESDAEWRQRIREQRDKMMTPPIVTAPPVDEAMARYVAYWSPAGQALRAAAEAAEVAQAESESKRPRPRRAKGGSANEP